MSCWTFSSIESMQINIIKLVFFFYFTIGLKSILCTKYNKTNQFGLMKLRMWNVLQFKIGIIADHTYLNFEMAY